MEKFCPSHIGTFLTPTDKECHGHESTSQQRFHNLHCQVLKCPHALSGKEKHIDVEIFPPRTLTEHVLTKIDSILKIFSNR